MIFGGIIMTAALVGIWSMLHSIGAPSFMESLFQVSSDILLLRQVPRGTSEPVHLHTFFFGRACITHGSSGVRCLRYSISVMSGSSRMRCLRYS